MTSAALQNYLQPVPPALLFGRKDPDDRRIGEVIRLVTLDELLKEEWNLVVLGLPDDRGVIAIGGRGGAHLGPTEIRRAWFRMTLGDRSQLGTFRLADIGDLRLTDTQEETHARAEQLVRWVLEHVQAPLLVLGGGHDYAYPQFSALIELCPQGRRTGLINVDAHYDVRPVLGAITSGCAFRLLLEKIDPRFRGAELVQFGTQQHVVSEAHRKYLEQHGATIVSLDDLAPGEPVTAFRKALERLSRWAHVIGVSFDMDAVRMSEATGVSAPSPIGLTAEDAVGIAHICGEEQRIRTFGIYEVSPPLDDGTAVRLAALMCQTYAMGIAARG